MTEKKDITFTSEINTTSPETNDTPPKKKKFGGRKKGTKNRVNTTVKENILKVFNDMGGSPEMVKWAKKNPSQFYGMYAKLIPRQIEAEVKSKVKVTAIKRTIIDKAIVDPINMAIEADVIYDDDDDE